MSPCGCVDCVRTSHPAVGFLGLAIKSLFHRSRQHLHRRVSLIECFTDLSQLEYVRVWISAARVRKPPLANVLVLLIAFSATLTTSQSRNHPNNFPLIRRPFLGAEHVRNPSDINAAINSLKLAPQLAPGIRGPTRPPSWLSRPPRWGIRE